MLLRPFRTHQGPWSRFGPNPPTAGVTTGQPIPPFLRGTVAKPGRKDIRLLPVGWESDGTPVTVRLAPSTSPLENRAAWGWPLSKGLVMNRIIATFAYAVGALLVLGACAATPARTVVTSSASPAKSATASAAKPDPSPIRPPITTPPAATTPPAISTPPAPTDPAATPRPTRPPSPPQEQRPTTPPPAAATITISGHVVDADGNAIQNALIEFKSLPDCPDICAQQQTRTDETGAYAGQLDQGIYVVYAFYVYPSGGMITLDSTQDPHVSGTGDFEVDFVMDDPAAGAGQGSDQSGSGVSDGAGGTGGSGNPGPAYNFDQDPNNPQYWAPVCASACDPGNGGLPDFQPGGGLTIPGL